jgi:predicted aconitase
MGEIMGESVGRAVEEARVMMSRAQAKFDELEVLVACVMALAEIAYLHVEDLTVFIRRRTWFSPR